VSTAGPPEAVRGPWEPLTGSDQPAVPGPHPRPLGRRAGLFPVPALPPVPPPGPDTPRHRWGLGAYLLVEAVFLTASVLLVLPYAGRHNVTPPPVMLLLSLAVPSLLAAGVAVLVTWLRGNGPRIDLALRFDRSDLMWGLVFGGSGLVLTVPAAAVWSWVVGPEQANSAVAELFAGRRFDAPLAIGVFLVVSLLAPVCEEIVDRGLLWGAVCRHVPNRWWAFGLTTLCFALAHFEFTRTPLLLVIAVPIGLARLYTGRLGASIIAHQLNNLLPAVSLLLVLMGVPV
jgi:membrane protease YdiL (CAAX protease family)